MAHGKRGVFKVDRWSAELEKRGQKRSIIIMYITKRMTILIFGINFHFLVWGDSHNAKAK